MKKIKPVIANKCNAVALIWLLVAHFDNKYLVNRDNTDKLKILNHQIIESIKVTYN